MAENRYQARGPENRTTLITVRVTADDRDLLQRLAGERGETVSRMLLAPWLRSEGKRRPAFATRSGQRAEKPVAATRRVEPAQPGIAAAADVDQAKATPIDVREPGTVEPAPAAQAAYNCWNCGAVNTVPGWWRHFVCYNCHALNHV